ncbi:2Fe-2S iron-sulfur cluster-binding protein [uncultured Methylobacterium sp.]|uniref:xanthine dehydrogenase family Fe-S subunit n=1 Tax=uncultured Methylobacterium sp. TaxID=157278 RepID=UPI0035CBB880
MSTAVPLAENDRIAVAFSVNGRPIRMLVEPRTHLADLVRDELNLTGTHLGCEHGVCGACTVLLDGEPARACLTFAGSCGGAAVTTIEGLDEDEVTAELRAAFNREHALQCGYCTPGMLVTARDLVLRLHDPDERRVRVGLAGNLCRCTGYVGIVRAITSVIAARRARGIGPGTGRERRLGPVGAYPGTSSIAIPVPVRGTETPEGEFRAVDIAEDFAPAHSFDLSFVVAHPPEVVFAVFGDVEAVAACLPGAVLTEPPTSSTVRGALQVRIGPISARFMGQARIERTEAERTGRILGAGSDAGGRSATQGEIRYVVGPAETLGSSRVDLSIGYTLKGPLAQFGRPGLVRDLAGRLGAQFVANLEARLSGAPAPTAAGLNPIRLLLSALLAPLNRRLAGWLGRGR